MMDSNRRRLLGFAGGTAALSVFPAQGQDKFPSKPIEVVTHSGVGGGTDITARMMMVHAPGVFKTEFVVVNRTGGSGAAAMDYLLERKDGHAIALITQTHLLTILRSKGKYKYEDLVPLARATDDPQIMMVGKNSPFKTVQDFVNAGQAQAAQVRHHARRQRRPHRLRRGGAHRQASGAHHRAVPRRRRHRDQPGRRQHRLRAGELRRG